MAERAARGDASGRPSSLAAEGTSSSSWRDLVERVTEVLWQQLALPTFEEWEELYRNDREGVEAVLLGFWKEQGQAG